MEKHFHFFIFILFSCKILVSQTLNLDWVKQLGYPGSVSAAVSGAACVDASGNVYNCGYFIDTVDFDPGPLQQLAFSPAYRGYLVKLNNAGNLLWVKFFNGYYTSPSSMTTDANGNLLITGFFVDTVDFDPGLGTYTLVTKPASTSNAYVLKMDANGNLIWARSFVGTTNGTEGASIVTDQAGNVYTTGRLYGTTDFDPGPGTYTLSPKSTEPFISKLDVNGNFVWAKQLMNTLKYNPPQPSVGDAIAIDNLSNIYVSGSFRDTVDFDPNIGTFTLSTSQEDAYIAKYSSTGNLIWAKQFTGGNTRGISMKLDPNSNVYIAGPLFNTCDFDPGPASYNLTGPRMFICSVDGSGNFRWAKKMGGSANSGISAMSLFPNSISGEICITGSFANSCNFDPAGSNLTLSSSGLDNIFITKFDFLGSFYWAKQMGGALNDHPYTICHDASGNLLTTGYFSSNSCDFDPEVGTFYLNAMAADAFIHKTCKICTTGIDNDKIEDNLFYIFPNPTEDKLFVVNPKNQFIHLKIYSSLGTLLEQKFIPEGTNIIDTENYNSGIYFIYLTDNSGTKIKKFVKL